MNIFEQINEDFLDVMTTSVDTLESETTYHNLDQPEQEDTDPSQESQEALENPENPEPLTDTQVFEQARDSYYQQVEDHIVNLQESDSFNLNHADDRFSGTINLNSIRTRSVVVIGAGGIGSWTIRAIAGMGFRNITVYDDDIIEHHNVGPQGHSIVDLGTYKVDAMYQEILRMRGTVIIRKKMRVTSYEQIVEDLGSAPSILISAVDNMGIRNQLAKELITDTEYNISINDPDLYIDLRMSMGEWNSFAFPVKTMRDNMPGVIQGNNEYSIGLKQQGSSHRRCFPTENSVIRKIRRQTTGTTFQSLISKVLASPEIEEHANAVCYAISSYRVLNNSDFNRGNTDSIEYLLQTYYGACQHDTVSYYLANECFEPSEGIQEACTERAIIYTGMNIGSHTAALVHWMVNNKFCKDLTQLHCFMSDSDVQLNFHALTSFNSREWLFDLPNKTERRLRQKLTKLRVEGSVAQQGLDLINKHLPKFKKSQSDAEYVQKNIYSALNNIGSKLNYELTTFKVSDTYYMQARQDNYRRNTRMLVRGICKDLYGVSDSEKKKTTFIIPLFSNSTLNIPDSVFNTYYNIASLLDMFPDSDEWRCNQGKHLVGAIMITGDKYNFLQEHIDKADCPDTPFSSLRDLQNFLGGVIDPQLLSNIEEIYQEYTFLGNNREDIVEALRNPSNSLGCINLNIGEALQSEYLSYYLSYNEIFRITEVELTVEPTPPEEDKGGEEGDLDERETIDLCDEPVLAVSIYTEPSSRTIAPQTSHLYQGDFEFKAFPSTRSITLEEYNITYNSYC